MKHLHTPEHVKAGFGHLISRTRLDRGHDAPELLSLWCGPAVQLDDEAGGRSLSALAN